MKILYGVVGEGMGHAIRSRVILEHLLAEGHQIHVMASGRAVDFLGARFREGPGPASPVGGAKRSVAPVIDVHRIHGLHMIYEENRVRLGRTLWSNVLAGLTGVPKNIAAYYGLLDELKPEVVISDFESWTYFFGKNHRLPVFSIDNMQMINRCFHEPEILAGHEGDFGVARAFVKSKLPFCDEYLITTFFAPKIRKDRTKLFPPILRSEILAARPSDGEHLLVYQTAEGNEGLAQTLAETGLECRIYGMRRGIQSEEVEGNLRYRPFSEAGFVDDLASARAVIAGGGFTLMGEAVYLHKPMLAVPVARQFEQILNGRYLEREGYGQMTEHLDAGGVHRFLDAVPACAARLAGHVQDGNRLIFDEIDHLLDRAASGMF